jgi:superfamily II DNA or RNA helicase
MATGTGKTRTALAILSQLADSREIGAAVVAMDGTDLLDQWCEDLRGWLSVNGRRWLLYRQYERHHELAEFGLDPAQSILVVSRSQLERLRRYLPTVTAQKAIIIHDEVHGLGAPALVQALNGFHKTFDWRLGLSATPDRAYDENGNDFVAREIGPTIFAFPIEEAIRRGVLSEFDYEPLAYALTENDRLRLKQVYTRQAARFREGRPMSQQELWTELARVYKTAEEKPAVFAERLAHDPSILQRCIIFVETREYGATVLPDIDRYTHRYRTYYADDDREHLVAFANGDIDCLITCHRISQGIDIRSLNSVVLFASARARLETIQRIGRCLRSDPRNPGKRARVIDFVRPGAEGDAAPNADEDRAQWLTALAAVRRETQVVD